MRRLFVLAILWAISTWLVLWGAYGVVLTINLVLDKFGF